MSTLGSTGASANCDMEVSPPDEGLRICDCVRASHAVAAMRWSNMDVRRLLKLVLAIFVTIGLSLAPVVTPSVAIGAPAAMTDMAAMSGDMPCCPSEQKSKDCQDCPLLAICVLKTVQAGPSLTSPMTVRHVVRTYYSVLSDALTDGVDRPPPDQPPRTSI